MTTMMKEDTIKILGARVHNLKNIDLEIPRRKLVFHQSMGCGDWSMNVCEM